MYLYRVHDLAAERCYCIERPNSQDICVIVLADWTDSSKSERSRSANSIDRSFEPSCGSLKTYKRQTLISPAEPVERAIERASARVDWGKSNTKLNYNETPKTSCGLLAPLIRTFAIYLELSAKLDIYYFAMHQLHSMASERAQSLFCLPASV